MRVIVISDNHGDWEIVVATLANVAHDFSIHLGDAGVAEKQVKKLFNRYVGGNNDAGFSIEEDQFELEGLRFYITHGHLVFGHWNYQRNMIRAAQEHQADIALFGHLHIPLYFRVDKMDIFCAGSIAQPRSADGPTFLILELEAGKLVRHQFLAPSH